MDEATTILFEDYLEGLLSEADRLAFEKRLAEDTSFAKDFDTYKELRTHLAHEFSEERADFKNQLENIGNDYFDKGSSEEKETKVIKFRPWQYGIAASIALLIGFFVIQNMGPAAPGDYSFSEQITLTERSADTEVLKQAETAFNEGSYEDAIANFTIALENDSENSELLFYKALSHDALAQYSDSDSLYERLQTGNSLYKYKATFYKAVSLWKRNNIEEAKALFRTIPDTADEYKDAQHILKKL
ncbi:hypothetical protein POV27_01170 [Aureisphaera galaxeae]|uniref:hypothetical protein n=1 Tax=Aureisphaera galaxeae TaxID=1538023 RepID=UPI00235052C7|nr:hypothetical protein [Aureisphaera galaxeae]MDC8002648.1 hypothetical protein [Aureisphaera galaxeae]